MFGVRIAQLLEWWGGILVWENFLCQATMLTLGLNNPCCIGMGRGLLSLYLELRWHEADGLPPFLDKCKYTFLVCLKYGDTFLYLHGNVLGCHLLLTHSNPMSDLVRHYDFPVLLRCWVTSDTFFFAFVRPLRCRSLYDTFPHVVRTSANK